MNGIAAIKAGLDTSRQWLMALVADIEGAELTSPTPRGGNHPVWVLGHTIHSEASLVSGFVLGRPNPLARWDDLFDMGSQPVSDASKYPSVPELLAEFDKVRAETLKLLDGLTDADLDKPSLAPPELAGMFGTIGQCLAAISLHLTFHAGQATAFEGATAVKQGDTPPDKWTVVRVDLWSLTKRSQGIINISLGAVGDGACFDQILLGRTEDELNAVQPVKL